MHTILSVIAVFLVALSPLVVGAAVLAVVRWASSRAGRHRPRPPLGGHPEREDEH